MKKENLSNTGLTIEEEKSVRTLYNAFNTKDAMASLSALCEDWQDIPLPPGQRAGAVGLIDLIKNVTTVFPDIQISIKDIIGNNHMAGVRAEMSFTFTHDFMGIKATGKHVNVALHEFHEFEDGKILKTWHLEDWIKLNSM